MMNITTCPVSRLFQILRMPFTGKKKQILFKNASPSALEFYVQKWQIASWKKPPQITLLCPKPSFQNTGDPVFTAGITQRLRDCLGGQKNEGISQPINFVKLRPALPVTDRKKINIKQMKATFSRPHPVAG